MKPKIWHWLSLLMIGSLLLSLTGVVAVPQSVAASPLTESANPPKFTTGEASEFGPAAIKTADYNPTPHGETAPGIYLVRLADAPLASYRGGIPGLAATSPAMTGQRGLNFKSPAVAAYTNYLAGKRAEFLKSAHQALGRQLEVTYEYYAANNGLAVTLTPEEALKIAALPGVIFVQRDFERELHTDNGPAWIGAPALWDGSGVSGGVGSMGEGVVIGVIDTGINYSNPSFAAVGPVDGYVHTNPLGAGNFLGDCAPGESYSTYCNDKLIGVHGYLTVNGGNPVDTDGHGSHTTSTAAGNFVTATLVAPTTVLTRTISGVAPHANIIAYAACCTTSALTAAVDDIVEDYAAILAVDPDALMTVNYSIGSDSPTDAWSDFDSVGYLNAREAGIFVATSAGNAGPGDETVGSPAGAPWLTSVGATTHDRDFVNELVDMSGGDTPAPAGMQGAGITAGYGPALIVYAGDYGSALCATGSADAPTNPFPAETFHGEIVVCDRGTYARVDKGLMVLQSGAGGMVLADNGDGIVSDPHYLPAVHISLQDGIALKAWIASGSGHEATISGFYLDVADANADILAGFSSRGANRALPDIIVPSVSAPGVSILAAYGTNNAILWDAISGTSMASPHVAGAAALIMALHPDWTPAEVQSALMTTAWQDVLKEDGITPADPFAMGSGRVDLTVAAKAGLVLDETIANYQAADPSTGGDPKTLNLASMGNGQCQTSCSWERTLRSTLDETITWTVTVDGPIDLGLSVNPVSFTLSIGGQTQAIEVAADVSALPNDVWVFGEVVLTPSDPGIPVARLPVAVKPTTGALPDLLQINTRRNAGSQWIRDLTAVAITNFTVQAFGLVQADLHDIQLEEDPTNDDPFDDWTEVYYDDVTVPTGARRLVAEITASTAPDVDLYVLRDTGSDYVEVCASTTASWREYCDLTAPEAGDY
ncbi:MAG: S8 family serine peptidase, partial [Anaerolineae bacterium]|nr:S8 family serine peptidase [Anaerolineae bacterium]